MFSEVNILDQIKDKFGNLTDWEKQYHGNMRRALAQFGSLTKAQFDKLKEIHYQRVELNLKGRQTPAAPEPVRERGDISKRGRRREQNW